MNSQERKLIVFATLRSVLSIFLEIVALIIFIVLSSFLISINGGADLTGLRATLLKVASFNSTSNSLTTGILITEITSIYLLKNIIGYSNVLFLNKIIANIQNRIAENLYLRFFRMPFQSINSLNTAEASAALVDSINQAIAGRISFLILGLIETLNILTILVVLSSQDLPITIILVFFCTSLLFFTYKRLRIKATESGVKLYESTIASRLYFSQGKESISIFSLSGRIPFFLENLNQERRNYTDAYLKGISLQQLPKYLIESFLLVNLFVLYFVTQIIQSQESTSLFLLLFFLAGFRILPSITRLQSLWLGWADSKHRVDSFFEIYSRVQLENSDFLDLDSHKIVMPPNLQIKKIVGQNLHFFYGENHVIKNMDFEITTERATLIRGPSGSGKSTLLNLIAGLTKPTNGCIKYFLSDGSVFDAISMPYRIGYVPQHPILFKGSVARNVILEKNINQEGKERLSEAMAIVDYKEVFPKEVWEETFVEAGGSNLSGGERQRINIARGIALQSDVLIMDEPTNSLDSESAIEIVKRIKEYAIREKKMVISTTHQNELHSFYENIIDL